MKTLDHMVSENRPGVQPPTPLSHYDRTLDCRDTSLDPARVANLTEWDAACQSLAEWDQLCELIADQMSGCTDETLRRLVAKERPTGEATNAFGKAVRALYANSAQFAPNWLRSTAWLHLEHRQGVRVTSYWLRVRGDVQG